MARVLIPFRHPHKVIPYAEAVRAEGAETATVLVTEQPAIAEFDGLLLMGGTDVNAAVMVRNRIRRTMLRTTSAMKWSGG